MATRTDTLRAPGGWLGIGSAAIVVAVLLLVEPIPQDPLYHALSDTRVLLGVINGANVLSNLAFVAVGVMGLWAMRGNRLQHARELAPAYAIWFASITLIGVGSGWYHLAPGNDTLVWDRLPMAMAIMALLAALIGECAGTRHSARVLVALLVLGIGSVVYWHLGERAGAGDLRPYALVQFLPLLLIPTLLFFYPARYTRRADLLIALGWYGLAKLFEFLDRGLWEVGGWLSGHTVKHLLAALACYWVLRMLRLRRALDAD